MNHFIRLTSRRTWAASSALLIGLNTLSLAAAPHHFQEWFSGGYLSAKPETHELFLQAESAKATRTFLWTEQTKYYRNGEIVSSGLDSTAISEMKVGQPLRILYQRQGVDFLAKRIIAPPPAEGIKSHDHP